MQVPFYRVSCSEEEIDEVIAALRSGWLTTGPRVRRFEQEFAEAVGASHAVAVNSCTAALHLAVEALELRPGQGVLVPTQTFAATAEIVRYQGAIPILVDCDASTGNLDLTDAKRKLAQLRAGDLSHVASPETEVVGLIPVHVGGLMMDVADLRQFAQENSLWLIEDAAHAFPAAWRPSPEAPWQQCGQNTASVTCFSFYANKTITTGEGGMAVTEDEQLAERMRLMSLHGLSRDAWDRFSGGGTWDYKIIAPGYKYNLTDIAAAIGIHQLARAETMRQERESIATQYQQAFSSNEHIELPPDDSQRVHAWHLYPIRLQLDKLNIDRNQFVDELKKRGVGCSVHWRPLHLHPYYEDTFGWRPEELPVASALWPRMVSLPLFAGMNEDEVTHVVATVHSVCKEYTR